MTSNDKEVFMFCGWMLRLVSFIITITIGTMIHHPSMNGFGGVLIIPAMIQFFLFHGMANALVRRTA